MQTLYKLIFVLLVLKARKHGLHARTLETVRQSKRDLCRDPGLPHPDAALAPTR